jgi:hypothetical protein
MPRRAAGVQGSVQEEVSKVLYFKSIHILLFFCDMFVQSHSLVCFLINICTWNCRSNVLVLETIIKTHWPSSFHYGDQMPRIVSLFHLDASWHCVNRLAQHLDDIDFEVSLVVTEWFLCLFAKSLPSEVRKFWGFSRFSAMSCELSCLWSISYLRRSLISIFLYIN